MSTEQHDFSAWDAEVDVNAISRSVMKAQANSGQWEKLPYDSYIVAVDDIYLSKSKAGNKQLVVQFIIVDHPTLNGKILKAFFAVDHQDQSKIGFMVHKANEFLRSLKSNVPIQGFQGYAKLAETCNTIKTDISVNKWEYKLRFAQEKGYDTYTIEEKYDTDDNMPF